MWTGGTDEWRVKETFSDRKKLSGWSEFGQVFEAVPYDSTISGPTILFSNRSAYQGPEHFRYGKGTIFILSC